MDIENIKVSEAILHVLDTVAGLPVLSTELLEMTAEVEFFLIKHLEKTFNSGGIKKSYFKEESSLKKIAESVTSENFVEKSQIIAKSTYELMAQNTEIPSADIVYLMAEVDGKTCFIMLKFNYKTSYIHDISHEGELIINQIVKQIRTIASESQTVDEFYSIGLEDGQLNLIEKSYTIDGKKENYLSEFILESSSELSLGKQQDTLEKVCKKVVEDRYLGNPIKFAEMKNTMAENVDYETNSLDVKAFVNSVNFTSAEKEYIEDELKERGIDKDIVVNKSVERKIMKRQKITTDMGIEITLPSDYESIKEFVEFDTNDDGTVNIIIKSVREVKSK